VTVETKFKQIDTDGDSYLTIEELNAARKNPNFSESEQHGIGAFIMAAEKIQTLNNDEWFKENNGISTGDLKKLIDNKDDETEMLRKDISAHLPGRDPKEKAVFGAILFDIFDRVDTNKNGSLEQGELERFGADANNRDAEREVADQVAKHYNDFKSITNAETLGKSTELYWGPQGPFYPKEEGAPEISRADVRIFNDMMTDYQKFEKAMADLRHDEKFYGYTRGIPMAIVSVLQAIAATKSDTTSGAILNTVGSISSANQAERYLNVAGRGTTADVRAQYMQRRAMLSSWQYFKD
jgi:hypothetical protein